MEFNVPSKTQRLRLCSDTDEGQDLTAAQLASRRTVRVRLRRELRWLLIARSIGTWPYSPWHFQPLISSLLWRSTPREVRRTHVTWFSRWYEGCESPSVVVHHRVQLWWRHRPRSISISSCSNSSVFGFFSHRKKNYLSFTSIVCRPLMTTKPVLFCSLCWYDFSDFVKITVLIMFIHFWKSNTQKKSEYILTHGQTYVNTPCYLLTLWVNFFWQTGHWWLINYYHYC